MAVRTCPHCKLISDVAASACDCGYDFGTGELPLKSRRDSPDLISSRVLTIALCCLPSYVVGAHFAMVGLASTAREGGSSGYPYGAEGWWSLYAIVVSGLPVFGWVTLMLGVAAGGSMLAGREASRRQRVVIGALLAIAVVAQGLALVIAHTA